MGKQIWRSSDLAPILSQQMTQLQVELKTSDHSNLASTIPSFLSVEEDQSCFSKQVCDGKLFSETGFRYAVTTGSGLAV